MGEETYAELVVRHERGSGAYWAELRHHIDCRTRQRSIIFKLAGTRASRSRSTGVLAAKLDGLYETPTPTSSSW
jgi:hypothetical protein